MFLVGWGLISYEEFVFTYHVPVQQYWVFLWVICSGGGAAWFFRLTTTASSLGIHATTVVQHDTNLWPRRMVGPMRDNINATAWSITWNAHHRSNTQAGSIFYRQQVESANAEQGAYRKISTSDVTTLVACAPSFVSGKRLRERCLVEKENLSKGMRDLHAPLWKRN